MDIRSVVGKNLRRLRLEKGVSQEALAVDAGVARSYAGRLERGLENPTVELLQRLADALETEVTEFVRFPVPANSAKPLIKGPKPSRGTVRHKSRHKSQSGADAAGDSPGLRHPRARKRISD